MGGVKGVLRETDMLSELLPVVSWLEFFVIGELCSVTWTGGFCFVGESNPKPASLRNLVGEEVTLCAGVVEGGRVVGWGEDKLVGVLVDLEGGPDGVLLGDILDFALLVEKTLSFFVVDWGVSEAARPCFIKRLCGLADRRGSSGGAGEGDGELLSEEVLPGFLATVTLESEGLFEGGSVEPGRYLGSVVALGLRLDALEREMLDALIFSVCDGLTSE